MKRSVLLMMKSAKLALTRQFHQKKFIACLAATLGLFSAQAQVTNYQFSQEIGTYSEITGTQVHGNGIDDAATPITLPFAFPYNGINYSSIYITSNGALFFATNYTGNGTSTPHSNSTFHGVIAAIGRDMRSNFATSSCSHTTVTEGNEQVFIVQYKDWSLYSSNTSKMNFQIRLHESGLIKFVYGECSNTSTTATTNYTVTVGLRGASTADFNYRTNTTSQSFNQSTAATATGNQQNLNFVNATPGLPANGLTYIWTLNQTACFVPGSVAISNITATGADALVNTTTAAIDYELRTSGAAGSGPNGLIDSGTAVPTTINLTGLTPATTYTLYTRGNCAGTTTAWSTQTGVFSTECVPFNLPYSQGFNATTIPLCWESQILTNTTNYITYTTTSSSPTIAPYEGTHFIRYNSNASGSANHQQILKSATIDATGHSDLLVEFFMHQTNTNLSQDRVVVNYSIDNGETWIVLDSVMRYNADLTANAWTKQQFILPAAVDNATELKIGLVFKGAAGLNMGVDAFALRTVPAPTFTTTENFIACASPTQNALITINGDNLHRATVTIGGLPSTIVSQSKEQVVLSVPAGVNGQLILTTPNGIIEFEDFVNIYGTTEITTNINTAEVCLNTPVSVNITSNLSDYAYFDYNFETQEGTVTGTITDGFEISSPIAQNFMITGVREVNGFECNFTHNVFYNATPGPGISRAFEEITSCEGNILDLTFYEERQVVESTGVLGASISSSTSSPTPLAHTFGSIKTQAIYRASELQLMGLEPNMEISAISFEATTAPAMTYQNFRVRIGHTTVLTATTTFIDADLQEVVAPHGLVPQLGVNTLTFDTPFIWDGTSGIVIETAYSNNNSGGTSTSVMRETMPQAATTYKFQDNVDANTAFNQTTGTTSTTRTRYTLYANRTIPTDPNNTITWTAGETLFVNDLANVAYNNENTSNIWYKTTANNDVITITATNPTGCTSTASYTITATPTIREELFEEACNWYIHRGNYLTTSGIYIDTFTSVQTGCDSLYILNLTIGNPVINHVNKTTCGTYIFNDYPLTTSGNYTGTFTSQTGCDSTVMLNLTVVNNLVPQIWYEGDTLYASANVDGVSYQWINCDTGSPVVGATASSFHPTTPGVYRVLIAEGTCTGNSVCAVFGSLGIEILDEMELTVAPNPTNGWVQINYASSEQMNATVLDAAGKEILSQAIYSGSQLDLSNFVAGVYVLKIENSSMIKTVRIVKN